MQQLPPLTDIGLDFSNNLFSLRLGGALLPNFISEADVFIYFDPAFLSHIFVKVRDMVPQDAHNKGDPAYPGSFTGAYLISTVQAQIRERLDSHMIRADVLERLDSGFVDRRLCLEIVRSLQSQILFSKVQGGGNTIQDDAEGLFMFADDPRYSSNGDGESPGIPTAIITPLTRCYAPSCNDMTWCYSCTCPRRQSLPLHASPVQQDKTLMSLPRTDICNEVSNGTVVNEVQRPLPSMAHIDLVTFMTPRAQNISKSLDSCASPKQMITSLRSRIHARMSINLSPRKLKRSQTSGGPPRIDENHDDKHARPSEDVDSPTRSREGRNQHAIPIPIPLQTRRPSFVRAGVTYSKSRTVIAAVPKEPMSHGRLRLCCT